MNRRLHVVLPETLHLRVARAARRQGISKSEWVRRALEECLGDTLLQLSLMNGPTCDIEQMLAEIEAGRREENMA